MSEKEFEYLKKNIYIYDAHGDWYNLLLVLDIQKRFFNN